MAILSKVYLSEIRPDRFDAEYFSKNYKDNLQLLNKTGKISTLGRLFTKVDRGDKAEYNTVGPIPVLRSVNVRSLGFNETRQEYVTNEYFEKRQRGRVIKDDIIITSTGTGTLGRTSIWYKSTKAFNVPENSFLRGPINIDPYLIAAFLSTEYGILQLFQHQRGSSGQLHLYPVDIKRIIVPECLFKYQEEIGNYLREAFELQTQSQTLYQQATDLLEQELGLDKITFEKKKSYVASFSEVVNNNRSDAEFFDIKFKPLLDIVNLYKNGVKTIRETSNRINTNYNFKSSNTEEIIYVEIGDINVGDGSFDFKTIKAKDAPANAKIKLSGGEILISMVRPTRGAISIVPEIEDDSTVVCSGAFYVINTIELEKREIVWLYLRLVKSLFEKYCGGSSYPTLDSKYLDTFPIPNFNDDISKKISDLISVSMKSKRESKRLLEEAKTRVEQLIEEAANS